MPIDVQDVMHLLCHLATVKGMEAAVIRSGQGALMAGALAFAGGMLAGPCGFFLGATMGGIVGTWITKERFKSVPLILSQLPPAKQKKLYDAAMAVLKTFNFTDAVGLIPLVMGDAYLQLRLTEVLRNYFSKELNAKLKCCC